MFDFVALEDDKLLFNSTPTTNAKMPDYDLNVPTVMITAKTSIDYFMDRTIN